MKALVKTAEGIGNIEIRDVPKPQASPGLVLIKVSFAGICGSDIHIYNWDTRVKMKLPVIMGHEFSGIIEEIGSGVEGWRKGDRVTAEPSYSVCGRCMYCVEGRYNLCWERKVLGYWADGAFTEYVAVPAYRLHKLPANISLEEGALTEPLACCVHGVFDFLKVKPGESVLLTGPGTIGLLAAQAAQVCGGVVTVAGTAKDAERLALAKSLGIENVFEIGSDEAPDGFDAVIECSGAEAAVNLGLGKIRKAGRYLQLGLFGKPVTVDFESIAYKELEVFGSFAQKWSAWKKSLYLMEHELVSLKPLVSGILPLEEWETGFQTIVEKKGLKVLLKPE